MNRELTVRDVIEWLRGDDGSERHVAARVTKGRPRVGHLTTQGFAHDSGHLSLCYVTRHRRRYVSIFDRDIVAGSVQLRGENGRYLDIREVAGC